MYTYIQTGHTRAIPVARAQKRKKKHERLHSARDSIVNIVAFVSEEEEDEYQDNDNQKGEHVSTIKDLTERLETLQKWNDILTKRGTMLQRALNDLESLETISPDLSAKIKSVNEKATQFKIAANAMIKVINIYGLFVTSCIHPRHFSVYAFSLLFSARIKCTSQVLLDAEDDGGIEMRII